VAGKEGKGKSKRGCFIVFLVFAAIVGILAAIAVSGFLKFQAKAKASEVKMNLGAIYTCQKIYYEENGKYAQTFEQMKWRPEGDNYYAYYCGDDMIPNTKRELVILRPGNDWPFPVRPQALKNSFACMGVGSFDEDDTLDAWTINDEKVLKCIVDDDNE